ITALSRIRWLFVIARNSSFTYKGQAVDVKQIGRELGVRYVLEGSVRKAGGRVRITGQLIDATNGAPLWADRFDVKQIGRELGVRYVLEGSVRKAGGRVRITGQLIDATNGAHLWADRFDGSLEDVFELQDQVAINVAGVIEPTLQAAEVRRLSARPTSDLTA